MSSCQQCSSHLNGMCRMYKVEMSNKDGSFRTNVYVAASFARRDPEMCGPDAKSFKARPTTGSQLCNKKYMEG